MIAHKCLGSHISMSLIKTLVTWVVVSDVAYSSKLQTGDSQTLNCANVAPNEVCPNPMPQSLAQYEGKSHKKRNAFNLYYMIEECTKCRAWDLLGYGNYCGLGGSRTPVDNIDRCCEKHDHCYGDVIEKNDCWRFNVYVLPYDWKVYGGSPYCGDETNKCRREICYCDKQLTECLNNVRCP